MEHEYWEERLQGYLDKELDPADHTAVEQHLAQCEDCAAQAAYFTAMKKRLKAHSSSVQMPESVSHRLNDLFEKKRNPFKRYVYPSIAVTLAAAAALMIFFLLPKDSYRFEDGLLSGLATCHDCHLAKITELPKGDLCKDGHRIGIIDHEGKLWRIAADDNGLAYLKNMELYGKKVEISGSLLHAERIIRIRDLKLAEQRQASL